MITKVANALNLKVNQVETVQQLASEGATIPFMARYRKEMTGNLDEVEIKGIMDALQYEESLQKRKADVLAKLEELEKNTPELTKALEAATTLQQVEDIYLPYRPKRRTKAEQGREKGLQPLADWFRDKSPYSSDKVRRRGRRGVAARSCDHRRRMGRRSETAPDASRSCTKRRTLALEEEKTSGRRKRDFCAVL